VRPDHHLDRRTRFNGKWRDLVDAPLNEASEAEIDVFDGVGHVVRTPARPPASHMFGRRPDDRLRCAADRDRHRGS
jgi:hypothetical protein